MCYGVILLRCYREQEERSRGELRDDDEPDAVTGNPFRPIGEELAAAKVCILPID